LTEASVETFAAKVRTEKDQGMVNGLIKALEKREGERIPRMLLKRLSEALKQIRHIKYQEQKVVGRTNKILPFHYFLLFMVDDAIRN